MTVVAPSPPPSHDELEALIKEARRRQRRRRLAIAMTLAAIAAAAGMGLWGGGAGGSDHPPHVKSLARSHGVAAAPWLVGTDTRLLMWPAGKPVFAGAGSSGETVRVVDLGGGRSFVTHIPQIAAGDFPYTLDPVGRWLVYNSGRGVAAIPADLHGSMRILGQASWFAAGVGPYVWLSGRRASPVDPSSLTRVNVVTGVRSRPLRLPHDAAIVISGTVDGLLLITGGPEHYRLVLWRPGRREHVIAPLGFGVGNLVGTSSRTVAYGANCRIVGRHGYVVCRRLTVRDLTGHHRWSLPAPAGTRGWLPRHIDVMGVDGVISPDRHYLVAQAVLAGGGWRHARMYAINIRSPAQRVTAVPNSAGPADTRLAWTIRGDWLMYQTTSRRLGVWRPGARARVLPVPCCQYATVVSATSAPSR